MAAAGLGVLGVAACSSAQPAPKVTVTLQAPSYPANPPPDRTAFIDGYNAVASENWRSLIGTPLVSGKPSTDATPATLCRWEANQAYKPGPVNKAYAAGCLAAFQHKPDVGS